MNTVGIKVITEDSSIKDIEAACTHAENGKIFADSYILVEVPRRCRGHKARVFSRVTGLVVETFKDASWVMVRTADVRQYLATNP